MIILTHKKIKVLGSQPLENVVPHIIQPSENNKKSFKTFHINNTFYQVKMSGQRMALLGREKECRCCGHTGVLFRLEISGCLKPHFNLYAAHQDGLLLMTMDHIVPKSQDGETNPENLQLLCKICNEKKRNKNISINELRKIRNITEDTIEYHRNLAINWMNKH